MQLSHGRKTHSLSELAHPEPAAQQCRLMADSVSTRRRQEADLGGHSPWRRLQAAALVGQGYLVEIEAEAELDTEA
jgi:hypothetical protein